jgi:hypothetical protein
VNHRSNPRDHGLGDHGEPNGHPWVDRPCETPGATCPNCGCTTIYEVKVEMVNVPTLIGGKGLGTYLGCPACPWASPMAIVSHTPDTNPDSN